MKMTTLAEFMMVAGAENRPPMLDKTMYNSWKSRMLLYIKGKKNGRMMLESIKNRPLLQDDCDVQATNIVLQGLPPDVYALVNHYQSAKDIWESVKLLMKGTELSYQERECKLYNEFNKFTLVKGETLYEYYLCFAQLINDMHTIDMTMQQVLLYVYLSQHEGHANEVRTMRERYPGPFALVAHYQTQSNSAQYPQQLSSTPQTTHYSQPYSLTYEAPHHPQHFQHAYQPQIRYPTPSVPQNAYYSPIISPQPQTEFSQLDSGLAMLVFLPGDDPIACLNKAMVFMSVVVASRFPSINNQLRTSYNLRNQATIQDGKVTVQQVPGRQGQSFAGSRTKGNATSLGEIIQLVKQGLLSVITAREKMMFDQAQESGQVLDEEQLAFLADSGIPYGQAVQITFLQNVAFYTNDLDAYDSDCDDISSAKAVLMANLSSYDSDVLSEVPPHDSYQNDDMLMLASIY
ncbi:hypothetical protein Tco_1113509 [Tanacetum coccineum]|uniref:Integrase, catalytic region, zinc finger, CCHC-type, peptidase aspartic, catalytic n=1 Tax=Tanacetum coccineum TaxID=301880 RepID=A0ABQ5ITK6_9ASTR